MNEKLTFLEKVVLFNDIGDTKAEYNTRKVGLYTSLILEEVSEMIESLGMQKSSLFEVLDIYRKAFKSGVYDDLIESALKDVDARTEYLDASVDIAVVATGAGISVGSDIIGAMNEVADNNLTKFPIIDGKYTVLKDENGKIKKPENYKSVSLESFLK